MSNKINILFLCTGNSCRSQMAEGWTRYLRGDQIEVCSAGIETQGLNPRGVLAMKESGVDISGHTSQHIDDFKDRSFDAVITVCGHAHENCPIYPGKSRLVHVGFDDPPALARKIAEQGGSEAEQFDCYRRVRDEIRAFVEQLPEALNLDGENCE